MKIAFCLYKYFPYGGLERDFFRLAQGLLARGHEIHVYTTQWQGFQPETFIIHLVEKKGLSNHQRMQYFSKKVSDIRCDVIIGFQKMAGLDFYFTADVCWAKKQIGWRRFTPRYRIYQKLENAVFSPNSKTKILMLVASVQKVYQDFYHTPHDRFYAIPPGIKKLGMTWKDKLKIKPQKKQELAIPNDKFIILHVGSNLKLKGIARSLQAIYSLDIQLRKKIHFYVIGENRINKYKKQAARLKLRDQVTFLSARDDVLTWMQSADLLLHPAYIENSGTVLVEALTCGLPVLTTANCGYSCHIEAANAGVVVSTPYQENINQNLATIIQQDNNELWQKNALDYAKKTDLYDFVKTTIALIENSNITSL